ncbi:MAG TPA: 50S ribosomal protein L6 [Patescibacteria group bacterium]|jgi:large subunit ribosomal protein L6
MSKIGNTPIQLPSGTTIAVTNGLAVVKGPKGELQFSIPENIKIQISDSEVILKRANEERQTLAFHGLTRSILANHVQGVNEGYQKTLKLVGTGYRVAAKGSGLSVTVGYSHPVEIEPAVGVQLRAVGNDTIVVEGIDKQLVGQTAANIRAIRPPEAYKGKGIRYQDEVVRTKPGKTSIG